MLFNEPKLLKYVYGARVRRRRESFSALQRAEIAEMLPEFYCPRAPVAVSVLFNEPKLLKSPHLVRSAESEEAVSVLFNEPKLLKFSPVRGDGRSVGCFSALQRAEIAEIRCAAVPLDHPNSFQCSSTSRNC